jgi:hypothetical protein
MAAVGAAGGKSLPPAYIHSSEVICMSTAPIAAANSSTLPALSLHGHGHKHGIHGDSQNDSATSSSSTSGPTGSTQNLFGSLMDSLESIIGLAPASASTGSNSTTQKS